MCTYSREPTVLQAFRDGETRTRTGDTTIFSRAALLLKSGGFAGNSRRLSGVARVRIFPEFAPVSRTIRPTARSVGLFVALDHRDRGRVS